MSAGVLFLLLVAWAVWTLTRLRRLETRVARAWTALDSQLRRRAGLAEELARNYPGALGEQRAVGLATTTRVGLARRFYNDAVRDTRALRRHRFPRLLRLHARRPLPRYFDIDDRLEEVAGAAGAGRPRS
jgi:hypothetical protein